MWFLCIRRPAGERVNPDTRVGSLVADAWQSRVLDVVDSKGSALVCAPTSSGKTLISGYCMRNVLSEDDEGIVVFVAPTKALVNQVRAQVAKVRAHRLSRLV
jgi:superfamily II RNA helicase